MLPLAAAGSIVQIGVSRGGIPKLPIQEAIVTRAGIEGDAWAHPGLHGVAGQALLLIGEESIQELIALGFALFPGALGENFTTSGLDRRQMRPGQRYRAGEALIEITKIRAPCNTLSVYGPAIQRSVYDAAVKAGNPASPRWGLSGFYASVLRGGVVRRSDIIALVDHAV